ncbi:MAG: hypothetical protein D6808_06450 [Candidatus Dadabacteria bacterium]|nr:MAG: hypothetical protein D6808_06450 [Candidatus Dadabacteria bacterium]
MSKIKRFASLQIHKITGGKDPVRLMEEFILKRGFVPEECQKDKSVENIRWMLPLSEEEELEILIEGLNNHSETTIYMGVNVAAVPIRDVYDVLAAALEIADGLVGIKVSLVGHFLVLSSSFSASGISLEDIEYNYQLIAAQKEWFKEALAEELDIELPLND